MGNRIYVQYVRYYIIDLSIVVKMCLHLIFVMLTQLRHYLALLCADTWHIITVTVAIQACTYAQHFLRIYIHIMHLLFYTQLLYFPYI